MSLQPPPGWMARCILLEVYMGLWYPFAFRARPCWVSGPQRDRALAEELEAECEVLEAAAQSLKLSRGIPGDREPKSRGRGGGGVAFFF